MQSKREKILELYKEGRSARDIASQLHIPRGSVDYNLRSSGIITSYSTEEQEKRIIELFHDDYEYNDIAIEVGLTLASVKSILKRNNLYRRRRQAQFLIKQQKTIELFKEGKTPAQIADITKYSLSSISLYLLQAGYRNRMYMRETQRNKIIELCKQGLSSRKIGNILNIDSHIIDRVKKYGR